VSATIAQMAEAADVSPRLMAMVLKVYRHGCPELWNEMRTGILSVHLALQICSLDQASQRLILAELVGMTARERTGFVRRVLALATARGEVA
jgi:hypothetical protein